MRVTSEMMVTGSLRRLQGRLERYERAQTALATGKWINRPSDDPAQASRGLSLRAAMSSGEQQLRAADDARSLVERADGELQSASTLLQRIRNLAVSSGTVNSDDARQALAKEMLELRDELVSIANTRHRGRAVFAGFSNDEVVDTAGTWSNATTPAAMTTQAIERKISDTDTVTVNVTAADVFGFTGGTDTFSAIAQLATDVAAGDEAGVTAGLTAMDTALGHVHEGLATLGAAGARIDSARGRTEDGMLTLRTELSEVEDVDVAEAIMNLQVEEVAYQATLQALGRSLPDTLVSFLR